MGEKSVTDVLEEVKEDICDNYCKYVEEYGGINFTDEQLERLMAERCDTCPLNRL